MPTCLVYIIEGTLHIESACPSEACSPSITCPPAPSGRPSKRAASPSRQSNHTAPLHAPHVPPYNTTSHTSTPDLPRRKSRVRLIRIVAGLFLHFHLTFAHHYQFGIQPRRAFPPTFPNYQPMRTSLPFALSSPLGEGIHPSSPFGPVPARASSDAP